VAGPEDWVSVLVVRNAGSSRAWTPPPGAQPRTAPEAPPAGRAGAGVSRRS
jgi:hypothetical protein